MVTFKRKKTSGNTFCGNQVGDYFKAIHQDDINVWYNSGLHILDVLSSSIWIEPSNHETLNWSIQRKYYVAGILSHRFCKIINANLFILHQKSGVFLSAEGTGYQSKDNLLTLQKNMGKKALTVYLWKYLWIQSRMEAAELLNTVDCLNFSQLKNEMLNLREWKAFPPPDGKLPRQ